MSNGSRLVASYWTRQCDHYSLNFFVTHAIEKVESRSGNLTSAEAGERDRKQYTYIAKTPQHTQNLSPETRGRASIGSPSAEGCARERADRFVVCQCAQQDEGVESQRSSQLSLELTYTSTTASKERHSVRGVA